jgi:hypothetical protein
MAVFHRLTGALVNWEKRTAQPTKRETTAKVWRFYFNWRASQLGSSSLMKRLMKRRGGSGHFVLGGLLWWLYGVDDPWECSPDASLYE